MLLNWDEPPLEFVYQLKVPLMGDDAPMVTFPDPHRLTLIAVIELDTTYAVAVARVVVQEPLEYST